ncbi:DUF6011 domain-containing protein [Nocardia sp. NPDC059246]|uniref:DUF6011 domain-containing protein n=1 Tax=unclassified Nocardia TaxID=2637762 RepID=UPI003699AC0B
MTAVELGDNERIARQCRRCGGWLVSAESIQSGLGPVCARHEREDARRAASEIPLFELEVTR